jgi:hypothetical protein
MVTKLKLNLTQDDFDTIKAAAKRVSLPMSTWLRMVAVAAARRGAEDAAK